jgi:hypothetical protein
MRLVTCVVIGLGLSVLTPVAGLAAGAFAGARPAGISPAFVRPHAGVIPLAQNRTRLGYARNRWGFPAYWLDPGWGYPPASYGDQGQPANAPGPYFAPRAAIYNVAPPLAQGDIGYVAKPVIYDVAREIRRHPLGRGHRLAK